MNCVERFASVSNKDVNVSRPGITYNFLNAQSDGVPGAHRGDPLDPRVTPILCGSSETRKEDDCPSCSSPLFGQSMMCLNGIHHPFAETMAIWWSPLRPGLKGTHGTNWGLPGHILPSRAKCTPSGLRESMGPHAFEDMLCRLQPPTEWKDWG